jgi:hypothetical protein
MSKTYLTAAGSILTVESRHSSYIRANLKEAPFPQPFDAPLTLDEVYSLASGFITSCPSSNAPLPVKAFPKLQLAPMTAKSVTAGATVTLLTPVSILNAQFWHHNGPCKLFSKQMLIFLGVHSEGRKRRSNLRCLYCRHWPNFRCRQTCQWRLLLDHSQGLRWPDLCCIDHLQGGCLRRNYCCRSCYHRGMPT